MVQSHLVARLLSLSSSRVLDKLLLVTVLQNQETQLMLLALQAEFRFLKTQLILTPTMRVKTQSPLSERLQLVFGMAQMLLLQMVVLVLLMQPLLVQTLVSRQLLVRLLQAPQLLLVLPLKAIRHIHLELPQQPLSTISIQLT